MTIFKKYEHIKSALSSYSEAYRNPFDICFERIRSPVEAVFEGKPVLLLGTNNYLGFTFDEACIEAGRAALAEAGTGTTGSRVANGTYAGHTALEARIAEFYGRRSAMVFSTGYQANLGMIAALAGKGDTLFIDADSHASIYDAARLSTANVIRFRHNDPDDLARRLARIDRSSGSCLIVVEGIYSMLGDSAPLREIAAVKREAGAYLMVDEAHAMGVLGEHGRGLCEAHGVEADVDFVVGTFSKSLGTIGGFAVSDHEDFDILRVTSRPYMFTASLPPSIIATAHAALRRIMEQPTRGAVVWANGLRLYSGLKRLGFDLGPEPNPIVAVQMPNPDIALAFWNRLLDHGIYLNLALPPATPAGSALLRASVTAAHTETNINQALAAFADVGAELGLIRRGCVAHTSADEPRAVQAGE